MKKYRKLFSFSLSALITMTALPNHATISTAQIMASSASPQCADYKVVGYLLLAILHKLLAVKSAPPQKCATFYLNRLFPDITTKVRIPGLKSAV